VSAPRRYLVVKTKWMWRWWTTLRPLRISGSGVHRGDVGLMLQLSVELVVQVKLLPTPVQASALEATLRACNSAASDVAVVARESGV